MILRNITECRTEFCLNGAEFQDYSISGTMIVFKEQNMSGLLRKFYVLHRNLVMRSEKLG